MSTAAEGASLLERAAQCYLRAGWANDACRCFEGAGEWARAARLHQEAGRWRQAAAGFERAGLWTEAAECHLLVGAPVEAADCLLRSGDRVRAAWLLADGAHRNARARAEVAEVAAGPPAVEQLREVVLARCDAGTGRPVEAARRLHAVLAALPALAPGRDPQRIVEWGVAVADALRRPDLAARLHAAAVRGRMPGARERWDSWALAVLGEAPSLPEDLAENAVPAESATRTGP